MRIDALRQAWAAKPGRPVSFDELIDAIWGTGRPANPKAALRNLVRRLRATEQVVTEPGGYRLVPRKPGQRQLPADLPDSVGRADEIAAALDSTAPVLAITGPPGVGKTSLTVHVAHRLRERIPDGQLHVNLRAFAEGATMTPNQALHRLLRALGAEDIPVDLDAQTELFRRTTVDRAVLIVIDNATRDLLQREEADLHDSIGDAYRGLGDIDKALAAHGEGLAISVKTGYLRGEADNLAGLAADHLAAGELKEALPLAQQARERAESGELRVRLVRVLVILAGVHRSLGDHDAADRTARGSPGARRRDGMSSVGPRSAKGRRPMSKESRLTALHQALTSQAGQPVLFDDLVRAVWGDEPPAAPLPALRTLMKRLRQSTSDEIVTDASGYRLVVRPPGPSQLPADLPDFVGRERSSPYWPTPGPGCSRSPVRPASARPRSRSGSRTGSATGTRTVSCTSTCAGSRRDRRSPSTRRSGGSCACWSCSTTPPN